MRVLIALKWIVVVAVLGLVAFLLWTVIQLNGQDTLSREDRADIRDEVTELEDEKAAQDASIQLLVDQLEALGQEPVVTPSMAPDGTPSLGLVQALVDIGLNARCGGLSCKGDPGLPAPPPEDGRDGTDGRDGETPSTELLLSLIQPLIPPPAVNGVDGVGILAITCTSPTPFPVSFDFALSNGTTQSVTCPVVIDPKPPVEPDPPA